MKIFITSGQGFDGFFFFYRARRLGEIILHSKIVLMLVVIINLLDCCLVLGELILDIHYIKGKHQF